MRLISWLRIRTNGFDESPKFPRLTGINGAIFCI